MLVLDLIVDIIVNHTRLLIQLFFDISDAVYQISSLGRNSNLIEVEICE